MLIGNKTDLDYKYSYFYHVGELYHMMKAYRLLKKMECFLWSAQLRMEITLMHYFYY